MFDPWRVNFVPLLKHSQCILVYHSSTLRTEKTNGQQWEKMTKRMCPVSLAVKYIIPCARNHISIARITIPCSRITFPFAWNLILKIKHTSVLCKDTTVRKKKNERKKEWKND